MKGDYMTEEIIDAKFIESNEDDVVSEEEVVVDTLATLEDDEADELSKLLAMDTSPQYDLYPLDDVRPETLFSPPIYERQEGESIVNHQKFLTFALISPGDRTVQRAYEKFWEERHKRTLGHTPKNIPVSFYQTAKHWRWSERAYALDLTRYQKIEDKWVERDADRRDEDWNVGKQLREKALQALSKINLDNGDKLNAATIARYLELASSLQQKSVPEVELNTVQITDLLESVSGDRKDRIVRILAAEIRG